MLHLLFNRIIIHIAKLLPLSVIKLISGRYVAGGTPKKALNIVKELNNQGYSATIDILGEHSKTKNIASSITNEYIDLYESINTLNLDCNISIKPSHIGLDINNDYTIKNLYTLLEIAHANNNFLRVDMEDSKITTQTIELYKKIKQKYSNVGIVLQAYLHRSYEDLYNLSKISDFNFRLCKGIYKENANHAIQEKNEINENFIKMLTYAFEKNIYVAIATHDIKLIKSTYELIDTLDVKSNMFEFQVLYGVPMSGWLQKHLENNFKVRIYVPFGKDWYDYSMRRLKENPNIGWYIIKNIFRKYLFIK